MTILGIVHILVLTAVAFRIMLFTRAGRHKPIISVLAYIIMVSAFTEVIVQITMPAVISLSQVMMEAALALALIAHHGNVAELFKATKDGSKLSRLLCWTNEKKKKAKKKRKTKTNKHHEVSP
ncbi:phage holin family protein [Idiomarina abyssalis]|uniref:phage holin family protein n=1 Tax=Idiomarina abyssalis TaxID=86102 RepID=UPI001CD44455|nr:phage holin family protein [Idiomarina abyssalis]